MLDRCYVVPGRAVSTEPQPFLCAPMRCLKGKVHADIYRLTMLKLSRGHRMNATPRMARPASRGQVVAVRAERSYVMVKPDGVQRGLVGEVISRFERKGFQIKGLKMYQTPKSVAEEHYKDLKEKAFYGKLVDYIISGPVVCIVCPVSLLLIPFAPSHRMDRRLPCTGAGSDLYGAGDGTTM